MKKQIKMTSKGNLRVGRVSINLGKRRAAKELIKEFLKKEDGLLTRDELLNVLCADKETSLSERLKTSKIHSSIKLMSRARSEFAKNCEKDPSLNGCKWFVYENNSWKLLKMPTNG